MGAASSSPTPPSSADADAAASAAAIRRRASARIQEERRRSEDMERRVWGLLADKEDLEAEKRRLLQGGASAAVAAAALGAGALALLQRRHASAMAALRIAATEAQQRHTSELERVRRFGAEPLARSLVPVCDNLQALCGSLEGSEVPAALLEGAVLTRESMQAALERHGVERHDPPAGARFDPSLHEAMFTAPLSDGAAPGTVSSVFRPGYTLHGSHILRAAQVGVFVGEAQQQPPPDADAEGEGEAAAAGGAGAAEAPPSAHATKYCDRRTKYCDRGGDEFDRMVEEMARRRKAVPVPPSPEAAPPEAAPARPFGQGPSDEQARGRAIEGALSSLSIPHLEGRGAGREGSGAEAEALAAAAAEEAPRASLRPDQLHELLVLHARRPAQWGAAALAARFGVGEEAVADTLRHCAAYRVVDASEEDSWMGVAVPILPDDADADADADAP